MRQCIASSFVKLRLTIIMDAVHRYCIDDDLQFIEKWLVDRIPKSKWLHVDAQNMYMSCFCVYLSLGFAAPVYRI